MTFDCDTDELLTVKQTAAFLGIHYLRIYNMINREDLPAIRVGPKTLRIPKSELGKWLASKAVRRDQITQLADAARAAALPVVVKRYGGEVKMATNMVYK